MEQTRAAADLWRHTLSSIPTVFGRLEYLASLRNPHSGRYEHYGLEQRFGSEPANETLRESHEANFAAWLALHLDKQKSQIEQYLSGREESGEAIVESWLRVKPFPTWVPARARATERSLFLSDLDALIELIRREYGVALPDPDA
jgi:hypothetical protein